MANNAVILATRSEKPLIERRSKKKKKRRQQVKLKRFKKRIRMMLMLKTVSKSSLKSQIHQQSR